MNILKLAAQVTLDGRNFKAGIKETQKAANDFKKDLVSGLKGEIASVFGAGALIAFTKSALEATARIKDLKEQSGISTDNVQRLEFAAKQMGLSFEDVNTALVKLSQARKRAAEGNQEDRDTFRTLGVSLEDVADSGIDTLNLFYRLGDAMKGMSRNAATDNMLLDLLGRAGPRLTELLKTLSDTKVDVIPEESIDRVDRFLKQIDALKLKLQTLVVRGLTPSIGANDNLIRTGLRLGHPFVNGPIISAAWRELRGMFGAEVPGVPGVQYGEPIGPNPRGEPIAQDKTVQAQRVAMLHAERQLEESILKLKLAQADASGQRLIKEEQIKKQLEVIKFLEDFDFPSEWVTDEKSKLAGMAADLAGNKTGSRLDVSQLTSQGQLVTGRNVIVANGDNPVAKAVLDLLTPAKETAAAAKGTLDELKKNPPIRLAR